MKRSGFTAIVGSLLLCAVVAGCTNETTESDQIVGTGNLVTQDRSTGSFSGIQIRGAAKVFVTQDATQSLRIQADDNIINRITTTESNGLLVVELQQGSYSHITINVYASMPQIKRLECAGAAEFVSTGNIQTDSLSCSISGAGKVTLTGTAGYEAVQVSGAGDVHNFGLACTRCLAIISGAGNIEVNVSQQLDAIINGTGNISYRGNPQVVNQQIAGAGTIHAGN